MKSLSFEYGGFHFTPYMKLTGAAGDFANMAKSINHSCTLFMDDKFSWDDFYAASPIRDCDLFKCEENGRIYIPAYNLFEYKGELHGINPLFNKKRDNAKDDTEVTSNSIAERLAAGKQKANEYNATRTVPEKLNKAAGTVEVD